MKHPIFGKLKKLRSTLIMFVPILTAGCFSSGLDLNQARSAREWISMCSKSESDIYCKAAEKVLKTYDGPIVFLTPNMGSKGMTDYIKNNYGIDDEILQRIARANLFVGYELKNGLMTSLDGKKRKVSCSKNGQGCQVEYLQGSRSVYKFTSKPFNGMIYHMSQKNGNGVYFLTP